MKVTRLFVATSFLLAAWGCSDYSVAKPPGSASPGEVAPAAAPIPPGPGTSLCAAGTGVTDSATCAQGESDPRARVLHRQMRHRYRQ